MNKIFYSKNDKAKYFRELHFRPKILILPNAWDALSAKLFERAGAKAIGTTSAGMAACLGFSDGERVPLELFFAMLERIIRAVNIPVTVDIESGMGSTIEEICHHVRRLVSLGAVGINIEDSDLHQKNTLISIQEQTKKISSIKRLLQKMNDSLFINARTDTYWLRLFVDSNECYKETCLRLSAYQVAGADGIFIPGLNDLQVVKKISKIIHLPLNILSGSWIPSLSELHEHGVTRLSMGSCPIRSVSTIITTMAEQINKIGKSDYFKNAISYKKINELFEIK